MKKPMPMFWMTLVFLFTFLGVDAVDTVATAEVGDAVVVQVADFVAV